MLGDCHQEYIANFTFHDMVFTCPSISYLFYGMKNVWCYFDVLHPRETGARLEEQ
jgi:hypothetical protein